MTKPTALSIAQDLIRCPSVTPDDKGALGVVEALLQQAGFQTWRVTFQEDGWPDTDNLYARIGEGHPHLMFAGHTDVVPPGNAADWRFDPFSAEVADGYLWGRGAVDMKGGIAASLAAVLGYLEQHGTPQGAVSFLITGDEEGPAVNGTIKLLQWAHERGERFDHCILGEPTNLEQLGDMIKIGRRGSLSGKISVQGKQGHVGYPHLADNPVHHLAQIVTTLRAAPLDEGSEHFDASNLEFTTFDTGNPAVNVIPASAFCRFNIRFNDHWTPETLRAEIQKRVKAAAGSAHVELEFQPTNALAFLTKPGPFVLSFVQAVEKQTGRKPVLSTTGGTSDARFIKNYAEVLEFGLIGQTMHAVDERINIDELEALAQIYQRVLEGYFSGWQILVAGTASSPHP
jgi:succinyl-diaminopimelate desuccinylase